MAETHGLKIMLLIFLEALLIANSKDANVTCIIQDDCILPCSFTPTSTVVIHWYKQQIPVHSYYYNKDQFGLQNKHFSGRTCLFNSHIPQGNASLLLRRVKVQDKGRYKCYTSTRKVNKEMFVNLEVKAPIQSVIMEMDDELVTCSSQNIYPIPHVAWTTDPPCAKELLENPTIKTTDHKGLYSVESVLRIMGNLSNYTYFCSFISADKTQVWTASWKNHEAVTQDEGQALTVPCITPRSIQDFSLIWTFASSSEPTVIIKYDNRTRHTYNQWESQAALDPDLLLQGDGSLLLHKPDVEQHSGIYTCTFSGLQSRHIVQTKVNVTVAPIREDEQRTQRSWWSTAASAAFVFFTVIVALPQCVRQREMEIRTAPHRSNGTGVIECGLRKEANITRSYIIEQHSAESTGQPPQCGSRDEVAVSDCGVTSSADSHTDQTIDPPDDDNDGPESNSVEKDTSENTDPLRYLP